VKIRRTLVAACTVISGLVLLMLAAGAASAGPVAAVATPTPTTPAMAPMNTDSWILVDLPPDATQLQHGAEIYRLVCSACHAYSGEGLTDAWRATWNPDDQNCWQSKCHAANHPPDGFVLPIAPAVVGRQALAPFQTAADLHAYIQATMPWQEPNNMTEDEGWAVTAYIIKLNRMNPPPVLNAETAAEFRLHAEAAVPTAAPVATPAATSSSTAGIVGASVLLIVAIVLVIRIRRRGPASKDS
jgi:mono/diheme cytochrome c family protein